MNLTQQLEDCFFDDAASEHITISADSGDEETAENTPGIATHRFCQSGKARNESRTFTIFDKRFLTVCIEQPRAGKKQYQFDLAFLDPTPGRFSGVAWRWLYATIVLATIWTVAFAMSWASETPLLDQRWLAVVVLLAVVTLITFFLFIHRTSFTLTFHSLHGKAPLAELAARSPTRSAVEDFVVELQQCMEAAREVHWRDKPQFLRDELRAHYRLWEEGVLTDETYEAGKIRILGEHG